MTADLELATYRRLLRWVMSELMRHDGDRADVEHVGGPRQLARTIGDDPNRPHRTVGAIQWGHARGLWSYQFMPGRDGYVSITTSYEFRHVWLPLFVEARERREVES